MGYRSILDRVQTQHDSLMNFCETFDQKAFRDQTQSNEKNKKCLT